MIEIDSAQCHIVTVCILERCALFVCLEEFKSKFDCVKVTASDEVGDCTDLFIDGAVAFHVCNVCCVRAVVLHVCAVHIEIDGCACGDCFFCCCKAKCVVLITLEECCNVKCAEVCLQ